MIFQSLRDLISSYATGVLQKKDPSVAVPAFDLSVPPSKIPGDLATNLPLMLAKPLRTSPKMLADEMLKNFPATPLIRKVEIAGAGFLNFWLSDAAFESELKELVSPRKAPAKKASPRVLIEFVSANPTGPLHVGHGRGAALGDSLARIFRYLGENVTTEFYINDAGGQIRNLGYSVEARIRELKGEEVNFPENGYKGSYIADIAKESIAEGKTFKPVESNQIIFTENDAAGYASKRNLGVIQKTLADFGVTFDNWYNETTLHAKGTVQGLIQKLREKNYVYEDAGATWFRATEFGDEKDRVLQKKNEAPTYFAADIAYHDDKFNRGYDKLVNIWGADHHGYAQRLKGAMKGLGKSAESIEVIFNQLVSIKGGRLSKRAGDMISLQEVVDEVGRDATRFFFALRSPGAHFEFDLDLAKKQASDNPVFYVQYVHARCCSIFREAAKRGFSTDFKAGAALKEPVAPAERDVILHLASFQRVVEQCARDFSNHHLTVYLQELAGKYHSFYETCHVLVDDENVRSFRLGLVDAIRRRVAEGLDLLGVGAPDSL